MPKSLLHHFVSAIGDGTDTTLVRPSNWNADHDFWLGYRTVTVATDTIANTDHMSIITYNSAAAIAVTLTVPSGVNFPLGWQTRLRNIGLGVVTVSGTGITINGAASIALNQNDSLDRYSIGTAAYIGVQIPAPPAPIVDKRIGGLLAWYSATQLQLQPTNGTWMKLNGVFRQIPAAGIFIGNTGVFVNKTAGQNLAASTLYQVYIFDNAGTLTADFWTVTNHAHAWSNTVGNEGTEVAQITPGPTLDDTRSFIGLVYTNASAQFVDSPTQRFVRSWFNSPEIDLRSGLTANRAFNSGGWANINAELNIQFVNFSGELVRAFASGMASIPATSVSSNLYMSTVLDAISSTVSEDGGAVQTVYNDAFWNGMSFTHLMRPAEGMHTAYLIAANSPAATISFQGGAATTFYGFRTTFKIAMGGGAGH